MTKHYENVHSKLSDSGSPGDYITTPDSLLSYVQHIVHVALELKNKHTDQPDALISYACIFSHTQEEYERLLKIATRTGAIAKSTPTGPVIQIKPLPTVAGKLQLLKIRKPDETRKERGDADFTVRDYKTFKKDCLGKSGFKLIEREDFEMIELADRAFDVFAYFSNPPVDVQYGLRSH